jgi:hypothetical protein
VRNVPDVADVPVAEFARIQFMATFANSGEFGYAITADS